MIRLAHPSVILFFSSLLLLLLRGRTKQACLLVAPAAALIAIFLMPLGTYWTVEALGQELVFGRVDRLSLVFGYIFGIITFLGFLFALNVRDDLQHSAAMVYAGSALGITFSGDLLSLYLFWELLAVSSTFLILARRSRASREAAFRYIMVHVFGGLCLLAGIVLYVNAKGSSAFDYIGLGGPGSYLIFIGIALNGAIPPLHPWLQDAYPEATETGAVFMSAFTTKSAVYVMARTFPGAEPLIWLGALMTAIPIFYAVLENDIRRVLSYSLINQVGFMMCGIGIGSALAINGTVAHAFCHILYKALLFMAAGSVLHMTGKIRCTDLGGLYKTMPMTCLFCMVGAASISAFPLFSGFVSKSMIISAAAHERLAAIWLCLQFASAGVFHHAGIKVPFFTFFAEDSGIRAKDPPINMRMAMGATALLCVFLGLYPQPLYGILPNPVHYVPYTSAHVVGQLQLLMFGALAFCLLILSGYYPAEMRAINLDADWLYRKGARLFYRSSVRVLNGINRASENFLIHRGVGSLSRMAENGPFRLISPFISGYWHRRGLDDPAVEKKREEVLRALAQGALPIGIGTGIIILLLAVMFLLS